MRVNYTKHWDKVARGWSQKSPANEILAEVEVFWGKTGYQMVKMKLTEESVG